MEGTEVKAEITIDGDYDFTTWDITGATPSSPLSHVITFTVGTFTKATGDQSVTIASPAANKYYKLEVDCAAGTSNGLLTLSKLVFSE